MAVQNARLSQYEKMTTKRVELLICKMAVPAIISMLITTVYNMADTYFVGKISGEAIAAVGVVYGFMSIIQAFGFLFGHGSGNYMSKMLGQQKNEEAATMAITGLACSMMIGVLLMVLSLCFSEQIAVFLGATKLIKADTASYLRALAFGSPFLSGGLTLNNQLRFEGKAFYGMLGIGLGGIINVILDPIMIFGLHMGVKGAGVATAFSQFLSFTFLLYLNKKGQGMPLLLKQCQFQKKIIVPLIGGGMPNFCRQAIAAIASILLNTAAGAYGEETIAAFAIVNRLVMMMGVVMIGFGQGFQPVCAYNYGAGKNDRVRSAFRFTVVVVSSFSVFILGIAFIWTASLISIFTEEAEIIHTGIMILRWQCLSAPILGWVIISGMFLQNIGQFKRATVVAAARQGICFIPLILILPRCIGFLGLSLVQPLADIGTFCITLPWTISSLKSLRNGKEKLDKEIIAEENSSKSSAT